MTKAPHTPSGLPTARLLPLPAARYYVAAAMRLVTLRVEFVKTLVCVPQNYEACKPRVMSGVKRSCRAPVAPRCKCTNPEGLADMFAENDEHDEGDQSCRPSAWRPTRHNGLGTLGIPCIQR